MIEMHFILQETNLEIPLVRDPSRPPEALPVLVHRRDPLAVSLMTLYLPREVPQTKTRRSLMTLDRTTASTAVHGAVQ